MVLLHKGLNVIFMSGMQGHDYLEVKQPTYTGKVKEI
jgi:hypothetical protein